MGNANGEELMSRYQIGLNEASKVGRPKMPVVVLA